MKKKHWQVSVFDKTSETIRDDTLYTTDTEVYLTFELIDEDFTPDSATVTLYNIYGTATINESVDIVNGIVNYEMPVDAIGHSGGWRTQVVFTKDNEDYTTTVIDFDVDGHLLDNNKPTIVYIENWNHFIRHGERLVDDWEQLEKIRQANERKRESAESIRKNIFEKNETNRQTNELVREENELARESAESDRVSNEEGRVTAENEREVAETDRNAKVAELSEEIADMKNEGVLTYTIELANKYYYNPDIEIDTGLNTITIPNHEFVEGESISFHSDILPNSNLPKGIVEGKLYTVTDVNNDTFKLNEVTLTSNGANDLNRAWFVSTSVGVVRSQSLNLHSGHIRIIGRVWLANNELARVTLNNTAIIDLTRSGKYVEFDFIAKVDDEFNEMARITGVAMSESDSRLLDGILRGGNLGYSGNKNIYTISIGSAGGSTRIAGKTYLEVYDFG